MKILSFVAAALVISGIIFSCKKLETCSYRIDYHSPSIVFVGFSESEVGSIIIVSYNVNTNFSELVKIDSLAQSSKEFMGDTAYSKIDSGNYITFYGFKTISEGFDYKITCLQTGKTFLITKIKSGETQHTWTAEYCSSGSSQTRFQSVTFDVDGMSYPINYANKLYLAN